MKIQTLLLTVPVVLCFGKAFAQGQMPPAPPLPPPPAAAPKPVYIDGANAELKYDFLNPNGNIPSNFIIKSGARVYFKIENINKSLYAITFNNSDKSLFTDKPPIFNLMTPDISKLNSALSAGGAGGSAALMDKSQIPADFPEVLKQDATKYIDARDDLAGKISSYINYYNTFKDVNSYYQALTDLLSDDCHDFPALKQTKLTLTTAVLKGSLGYTGNSQDEVFLGSTLKTGTENLLKGLDDQYTEITRKQTLFGTNTTAYQTALTAEAVKDKGKKADAKLLPELAAQQQELSAFQAILDESMTEVKSAKIAIDAVKTDFSSTLKKTYDKINYSNFTFISPSYTSRKDLLDITMSIQPKAQLVCDNNYAPFNTTIEGKVTGFKMNFSTGLFAI
ncbi:MAG: hypothetical protein JWR02_985, partial [Mucilaginibacter sp.]|nr:hypothetical protein [Mucilaginibacter sp.]